MAAALLRASISVSSMRSGLAVPGDDVACTSAASAEVGAVLWAGLAVVLVPLADLDLLEALALLEVLDRLEVLAAGALGAVMPLVVTAIGAEGRGWVQFTVSGLDERV